jgi:hypothetical protein
MDSKHRIIMQVSFNSGSTLFNYKPTDSTAVMALVGAGFCFLYVYVGSQGRIFDGGL